MTDEQLQAIRQRWMDSTPGEWITTADVDIDGETPYWDRVISVAVSDEYAETALSEIVQLPECMDDVGDALMEMQNSAFALGYLRAQNEAALEIARAQHLLDQVPVRALWRYWRSSKLADDPAYNRQQFEADFQVIFDWFATVNVGEKLRQEERNG